MASDQDSPRTRRIAAKRAENTPHSNMMANTFAQMTDAQYDARMAAVAARDALPGAADAKARTVRRLAADLMRRGA